MANPPYENEPKWVKPGEPPPQGYVFEYPQQGNPAPAPQPQPQGQPPPPPQPPRQPGRGPSKRPSSKVFVLVGVAAAILIALAAQLATSYGGGAKDTLPQSAPVSSTAPQSSAAPQSRPAASSSGPVSSSKPEPPQSRPEGQPAAPVMEDIGLITLHMPADDIWYFETGKHVSSNACMGNIDSAGYSFYFVLYLEDDVDYENPLYVSDIVPEGYMTDHIALDVPLEKGTHTVECVFYIVNEDNEVFDRNNKTKYIDLVIEN